MRSAALALLCLLVGSALASSHSEAPGTASSPKSDLTDFYMFRSYEPGREDYVTFIANVNPLQDTLAGPNYFPLPSDFVYNIHVDNTGDAVEDLTFQFIPGAEFSGKIDRRSGIHEGLRIPVADRMVKVSLAHIGPVSAGSEGALNYKEHYQVRVFKGPARANRNIDEGPYATRGDTSERRFRKPFDYAGTKTFADYKSYADSFVHEISLPGCAQKGRVFVGQRKEPFHINLGQVFDLVNLIPAEELGGSQDPKFNTLANKAITTIALEVHNSCLRGPNEGKVGAWASVQHLEHVGRRHTHMATAQKTRLGNPLVNELLIGLTDKDDFGQSHPRGDKRFLEYFHYPTVPEIVELLFGKVVRGAVPAITTSIAPANYPRTDLSVVLLGGIPGVNALTPPEGQEAKLADMLRLNMDVPVTPRDQQKNMAVIDGDNAGYPNGRRPGDDVVDITLRVAMGRLCHPPFDAFKLCTPAQAPAGTFKLTDRAPLSAADFDDAFPYLRPPIAGSALRCEA